MPRADEPLSRVELLQGTLDLIILQSLRWGPRHGYGLAQLIRTGSGELLQVDTGSLYPALHRLEKRGLIEAEWVVSENKQRVKEYRLSAAGRKQLVAERTRWEQFSSAMAGIFEPPAERGT
jgi:transcriptional regulator